MSRSQKQAGMYFLVPCLFLLLLYGLYNVTGVSIEKYITSQLYMVIEQGNPDYRQYPTDAEIEAAFQNRDGIEKSEISYPSIGERYAKISCDEIGLDVYLYYGDEEEILKQGIGQAPGSSLPGFGGTILVCGYDHTYLSSLSAVEKGNTIMLDTNYGRYQYVVQETKIVDGADTAAYELDSQSEQLVLYTSYPFGEIWKTRNEKFVVYCDKVSGPEVEE